MGPGPVRPVKTVKDFIQLVLGYALALIPKRKPHIARLSRFQPDFHPAILAPVFDAVAQHIGKHPLELFRVQGNGSRSQGTGKGQGKALFLPIFLLLCQTVFHKGRQVHRLPMEGHLVQIQFGQKQQGLVQPAHAFRGGQNFLQVMLLFFRSIGNAFFKAGGIALDFGQGSRQIVDNPRHHFFSVLFVQLPFFPVGFQFQPGLFKSPEHGPNFILAVRHNGGIQIPPADLGCRRAAVPAASKTAGP